MCLYVSQTVAGLRVCFLDRGVLSAAKLGGDRLSDLSAFCRLGGNKTGRDRFLKILHPPSQICPPSHKLTFEMKMLPPSKFSFFWTS